MQGVAQQQQTSELGGGKQVGRNESNLVSFNSRGVRFQWVNNGAYGILG